MRAYFHAITIIFLSISAQAVTSSRRCSDLLKLVQQAEKAVAAAPIMKLDTNPANELQLKAFLYSQVSKYPWEIMSEKSSLEKLTGEFVAGIETTVNPARNVLESETFAGRVEKVVDGEATLVLPDGSSRLIKTGNVTDLHRYRTDNFFPVKKRGSPLNGIPVGTKRVRNYANNEWTNTEKLAKDTLDASLSDKKGWQKVGYLDKNFDSLIGYTVAGVESDIHSTNISIYAGKVIGVEAYEQAPGSPLKSFKLKVELEDGSVQLVQAPSYQSHSIHVHYPDALLAKPKRTKDPLTSVPVGTIVSHNGVKLNNDLVIAKSRLKTALSRDKRWEQLPEGVQTLPENLIGETVAGVYEDSNKNVTIYGGEVTQVERVQQPWGTQVIATIKTKKGSVNLALPQKAYHDPNEVHFFKLKPEEFKPASKARNATPVDRVPVGSKKATSIRQLTQYTDEADALIDKAMSNNPKWKKPVFISDYVSGETIAGVHQDLNKGTVSIFTGEVVETKDLGNPGFPYWVVRVRMPNAEIVDVNTPGAFGKRLYLLQ